MAETVLRNVNEVHQWLIESGWEISRSAVYSHRRQGKILPDKMGRFPIPAVRRYAERWIAGASAGAVANDLSEQKLRAEIEKTQAQARHWELRAAAADGSLVPRDAFERELASRALIFRSDGENWLRAQAPAICAAVHGDETRIPDLVDMLLSGLEAWLARYAEEGREWAPPGIDIGGEEDDDE